MRLEGGSNTSVVESTNIEPARWVYLQGAIPKTDVATQNLSERQRKPARRSSLGNGTELTSHAVLAWCQDTGVEWHYIAPGKPQQNGFGDRPLFSSLRLLGAARRPATVAATSGELPSGLRLFPEPHPSFVPSRARLPPASAWPRYADEARRHHHRSRTFHVERSAQYPLNQEQSQKPDEEHRANKRGVRLLVRLDQ